MKEASSETNLLCVCGYLIIKGFFTFLTVSDRVVPLSVCWSDVQTEGQVVLSSVLPGEEVQQDFKVAQTERKNIRVMILYVQRIMMHTIAHITNFSHSKLSCNIIVTDLFSHSSFIITNM